MTGVIIYELYLNEAIVKIINLTVSSHQNPHSRLSLFLASHQIAFFLEKKHTPRKANKNIPLTTLLFSKAVLIQHETASHGLLASGDNHCVLAISTLCTCRTGWELDYPSHMKVTYGHLAVTGESAECKTDSWKSGISWPGKSYNFSKK